MNKILAGLLIISVTAAGPLFAANTSIFYQGNVVSLPQPEVAITSIYGLKISPMNVTMNSGDKTVYFAHTIENLSNNTSKINVGIIYVSQAKGWSAQLIQDENGDGNHQDWENKPLDGAQNLGEGAVVKFFLKLTRPDDAKQGDAGSAIINASCTIKDGDGYVGYDGLAYGGPDEAETTDTVMVK